ncbi:MAG: RNA methyltransferase [Roseiflexaceae bacterium]|nr:RNA methyltransferase [Roseiflexaceae bacterium]
MITSTTNAHVKNIRALAGDRKLRRSEQLFVLEGVRLVADALASEANLRLVLYAPEQLATTEVGTALLTRLQALPHSIAATPTVIAAAAETVQPQGVVALASWPQVLPSQRGIVLALDVVQDPGNLGTLLRSAEACGVVQVLCARGTTDVYSPKVVRAGMGAHFRLSITQDMEWHEIGQACAAVDHIYASVAGATMPYYAADWRQPSALIISNEANGLSDEAAAYATRQVSIPMRGTAESLNAGVAGSVILFEALRQRTTGRGG